MVKFVAIGCGGLLAFAFVVAGIASWFAMHAVHAALTRAPAMHGAVASQGSARAADSPEGGIAILKSFVTGGRTHVDAVPRPVLKAVLPTSVDALARSNAESSASSISGISGTSVSASYGSIAAKHVKIEVTDAANMTGLTTFMTLAMGAVTTQNDEGYERNAELGAVRVHETWIESGAHATLLGLVGNRFVVTVDSVGLEMPATERAFQEVDTARLTTLATTAMVR